MYEYHSPRTNRALLRLLFVFGLVTVLITLGLSLAAAEGLVDITRLSTASSGDRSSEDPSISADGTRIAFESDSDFLGQGIPRYQMEIWLYETGTMTVTRVTTAAGTSQRQSLNPDISGDGTKIAFDSDSDFLGQAIPQYQREIWLYDTQPKTLERLTNASGAGQRQSINPSVNSDGTKIAFESDSDFLGQGLPQYQREIWLYDTGTMTVTRVTSATGVGTRNSQFPSISADGTRIAFQSDSDFLSQGIDQGQYEIWLYDTQTMTLTRVTTASDSARDSQYPSISSDGTKIAFQSDSDFLGQGISPGQTQIWLYDTSDDSMKLITTPTSSGTMRYITPSLSGNGNRVAFVETLFVYYVSMTAQNGSLDDSQNVWLYDLAHGTMVQVTRSIGWGYRYSENPCLNENGIWLTFDSDSDLLNQSLPRWQNEIWLALFDPEYSYVPAILVEGQ